MKGLASAFTALAVAAVVLTGCGGQASATCPSVSNGATVCLNGRPIDFSGEKDGPHQHESGNVYAPVFPLARALGVQIAVDPRTRQVTVDGRQVQVTAATPAPRGIHAHNGAVFVPVKEFAAAAGLKVVIDDQRRTASFSK